MQTGATIHTMNGLNLIVRKRSSSEPPKEDNGWWEQQHLKRGLDSSGKPYSTEEDAVWSSTVKAKKVHHGNSNDMPNSGSGCPVKH